MMNEDLETLDRRKTAKLDALKRTILAIDQLLDVYPACGVLPSEAIVMHTVVHNMIERHPDLKGGNFQCDGCAFELSVDEEISASL